MPRQMSLADVDASNHAQREEAFPPETLDHTAGRRVRLEDDGEGCDGERDHERDRK
jgi:hypothetical protein